MLPSDMQPYNPPTPNSMLVDAFGEAMQDSVHSTCSLRTKCHSANINLEREGLRKKCVEPMQDLVQATVWHPTQHAVSWHSVFSEHENQWF